MRRCQLFQRSFCIFLHCLVYSAVPQFSAQIFAAFRVHGGFLRICFSCASSTIPSWMVRLRLVGGIRLADHHHWWLRFCVPVWQEPEVYHIQAIYIFNSHWSPTRRKSSSMSIRQELEISESHFLSTMTVLYSFI